MKKWIAILAIWMLCTGFAAAETANETSSLTLAFDSNASTGYAWTGFVLGGDSVEIERAEGSDAQDASAGAQVGAGETTDFILTAVEPGSSIVTFEYRCAWEDEPAQRQILLAIVDEALNLSTVDVSEDGVIEGAVSSVDMAEHCATLISDDLGELIARFQEGDALPVQGETIRIYTSGAMTMSLPAIVNAIAWERIPPEAAREAGEPSAPAEENSLPTFWEATGLDAFLSRVSAENPIASADFTEGTELPTEEFTTTDPAELAALLDAVEALEIDSVSDLSVTDWYPRLRLSCADGTSWSVGFNGHCLEVDRTHYNLRNDDAFWTLTRRLLKKYAPEE